MKKNKFKRFLIFPLFLFLSTQVSAADSLGYSGRLVNNNGSPVQGPVTLRAELAYTNAPSTILCTKDIPAVVLTKGVFHLKLVLNCAAAGVSLTQVLAQTPPGESVAIRITDVTNSKTYPFQAMHSIPFSNLAEQIVQMGATTGQFLQWDGSKWTPASAAASSGGTVTGVTSGGLPISVTAGAAPVVSIAQANTSTNGYLTSTDWNIFNNKQGSITAGTTAQYYRGDKSWQTLDTSAVPENVANLYYTNARVLGVPLTGFSAAASTPIVSTDTTLQAFGKAQGQIDSLTSAGSNYLIKNGADTISGTVSLTNRITATGLGDIVVNSVPLMITSAVNKTYVDTADGLKVNKSGDTMSGLLILDGDLKIKGGSNSNYVTLKSHATTGTYNLFLPSSAGTTGYVLSTDGSGNTSWINPASVAQGSGTVDSASIVDGTIVDADVNATAAIAQSKIANLTTDLALKQTTSLANGNILVGSAGGVATAVAVSGDATLANTGAVTLANSGVTANTYTSVTVDVKGRVTGGTNPTTLAGYGITDTLVTSVAVTAPLTKSGAASLPIIAIPVATTTDDGYLAATDWTIFNNKQPAITTASTLNTGSITTNLQGGVALNPYGAAAGNTGEIHLKELAANGTNYVALKSPDTLAANIIYTLPAADGSSGQVLTTNSTGGLSWTTVATGGTTLVGDIGGTIGANTIGAGKVTLPKLSASGTASASTYLRGDDTWSVLQTDVQALVLSAYTVGTNAVVSTSDTVASAFGKLQKQITDLGSSTVGGDLSGTLPNPTIAKIQTVPVTITTLTNKNVLKYNGTAWVNSMVSASDMSASGTADATTYLAGDNTWKNFYSTVIDAPLTGLTATATKATSTLASTDSISTAFNKLLFTQGDYLSKTTNQTINGSLAINSLTGFLTVPTPVNPTDAANKSYVDGFGQWTINGSDIYRSSGNVGIGTSPTAPLDVAGTIRTAIPADGDFLIMQRTSQRVHKFRGEGQLFKITSDSPTTYDLYLDASNKGIYMAPNGGNVGIGTTSPAEKLTVTGGKFAIINAAAWDHMTLHHGGDAAYIDAGGAENGLVLRVDGGGTGYPATSYPEVMRLLPNGNVGIGTATPSEALQVNGAIKATGTTATNLTSSVSLDVLGGSTARVVSFGPNASTLGAFNITQVSSNGSLVGVPFYISPAGNVGIGTTSPEAPLEVNGDGIFVGDGSVPNAPTKAGFFFGKSAADTNRRMEIVSPVAGESYIDFTNPNVDYIGRILYNTNSNYFSFYTNTTEKMRIDTSGNVGIGTSAPAAKLDVNGQIRPSMGTPTVNPASNAIDFQSGNTQYSTFTSCPGNNLTVNLYSLLEGGSYSLVLITPANCLVTFTGTGGGVNVTSFKYPAGQRYTSTANPVIFSFLRANNIMFVAQVVDFQ